jgi:lipopolysaccharide/colanic/teichoic acid biosynthesis glycosyltransferase
VGDRPATQLERIPPSGGVPPSPREHRPARTVKYAIDRVAAALAIVITAPLFLLVALTLLALGRRRVLNVEVRIGERGAFALASFDLPPEGSHPWVVGVVAGSGLVALPQLFSLLLGHLSLIGPRPRYPGEPRPPARPGMAGLAQAEQRSRVLNRDEVFALDAEYAERWSLGFDVRVAALGARHMLSGRRSRRH